MRAEWFNLNLIVHYIDSRMYAWNTDPLGEYFRFPYLAEIELSRYGVRGCVDLAESFLHLLNLADGHYRTSSRAVTDLDLIRALHDDRSCLRLNFSRITALLSQVRFVP